MSNPLQTETGAGIEIHTLGPAEDPLKNLTAPLSEDTRQRALQLIASLTDRVRGAFRAMVFERLQTAEAEERLVKSRLEENERQITVSEEKLKPHAGGSFVKGMLSLLCFVACFLAEIVFNRAVLPWLLSISPETALGIALAVAPATAPIILDVLIKHLFDIEDPWVGLRTTVFSPSGQRARRALSILFIVAATGANLTAIWLLADCREVTSKFMGQEMTVALNPADEHKIQLAIQSLSIVLCVDGALFYLLGLHELRGWEGRRKLRRAVLVLRSKFEELQTAHSRAAAVLAVRQAEWNRVDADAQSAAHEYELRQHLRLAEIAAQRGPAQTAQQRVMENLERSLWVRSAAQLAVVQAGA